MCEGNRKWQVVVLAASRGPDDPMAAHFGVSHKCLIRVGGSPLLARVIATLRAHKRIGGITVSIEDFSVVEEALDGDVAGLKFLPAASSAPASVLAAIDALQSKLPVLITTADHALLDADMISHFLSQSDAAECDMTVGLASAEVILRAYPNAKRTFVPLGPDKVSGCNLFAVKTAAAGRVIDFWRHVERSRKNPVKLIGSFGLRAIVTYLLGRLTLARAFELASRRIGARIKPVMMPQANAAIDVDKPQDKELVEQILSASLAVPQGADEGE